MRSTCEGQNGAVAGASQETAEGAEGPSPAGGQPRSTKISHCWASPSLCLCVLCWEPLLRLHKTFSPSFAEPYTILTFPSTENKTDTKVVKKDALCYVSVSGPLHEQKVLLFYFLINNNKILH